MGKQFTMMFAGTKLEVDIDIKRIARGKTRVVSREDTPGKRPGLEHHILARVMFEEGDNE